MTTDNRANEPTPEQVLVDEWIRQADRSRSMTGMDAIWFPDAEETLAALRANGLLSEGAPSEALIAEAKRRARKRRGAGWLEEADMLDRLIAALVAAQGAARPVNGFDTTAERVKTGADSLHVAPQEPNQNETKSGKNLVSLDPEKVAEVLMRHEFNALGQCMCGYATPDYGSGNRLRVEEKHHFARALCEEYTEGRLTK